jgi:hypothetical protein
MHGPPASIGNLMGVGPPFAYLGRSGGGPDHDNRRAPPKEGEVLHELTKEVFEPD